MRELSEISTFEGGRVHANLTFVRSHPTPLGVEIPELPLPPSPPEASRSVQHRKLYAKHRGASLPRSFDPLGKDASVLNKLVHKYLRLKIERLAGWPWVVANPGLPQIRTCPIKAYGSSYRGFAARRYTEWTRTTGASRDRWSIRLTHSHRPSPPPVRLDNHFPPTPTTA